MTGKSLWRRALVPATVSLRHAIVALEIGFLLEAGSEVYQLETTVGPVGSSPVGYYAGLAAAILGFYFFWRGLHEWSRLRPKPARGPGSPSPGEPVGILAAGIVATALWNFARHDVGAGDSPPALAWVVGGLLVLAVGSFFLSLQRRVAFVQGPVARGLGWAAFLWSLGVSVVAGLVLGQAIVGLFIDFFTSWPALFRALAPFIATISPLFVAFALIAGAYLDAVRRLGADPAGDGPRAA